MKVIQVTMVRIYITESSKLLKPIIQYLQEEAKVRGISVFRAVSGYGETGAHLSSFMDLSLDLPLAIEFFDHPEQVKLALEKLSTMVKPEHVVFWDARANDIE
ncbi:MAG: DUF190 domain-containing protein [Gammaproteobacteria bacterium]|nr:DUF190 domain-containing protein [Gammaproteobacteria bacterium]